MFVFGQSLWLVNIYPGIPEASPSPPTSSPPSPGLPRCTGRGEIPASWEPKETWGHIPLPITSLLVCPAKAGGCPPGVARAGGDSQADVAEGELNPVARENGQEACRAAVLRSANAGGGGMCALPV